ncbi:MAG: 30S ribosome-binding factor RbfA [Planctomycetota bacterium]|jgi:ribosome-binding factor A|nr:30S ribosome-binding factor RbfA [Planctomycetota bacterium]
MAEFINAHGDRDEFSKRRNARLESLLKREIATMVTQQLRDPRIGFVTVTRCELSGDNSQVTAYYTVFGNQSKQRLAGEALESATPYIQRGYAKHVRRRRLPILRFQLDDNEEQRQELERALEAVREERVRDDEARARADERAEESADEAVEKPDDAEG